MTGYKPQAGDLIEATAPAILKVADDVHHAIAERIYAAVDEVRP